MEFQIKYKSMAGQDLAYENEEEKRRMAQLKIDTLLHACSWKKVKVGKRVSGQSDLRRSLKVSEKRSKYET